jgi:hypothetical protein
MPDMQFSRTRLLLRPEKVVSAGKPSKGKIKRGGARWALVPDDLGMGVCAVACSALLLWVCQSCMPLLPSPQFP